MNKARFNAGQLSFADATSAIMAGVFILACALIRTSNSEVPPKLVSGKLRIEIPIFACSNPDLQTAIDEAIAKSVIVKEIRINARKTDTAQPLNGNTVNFPLSSITALNHGRIDLLASIENGVLIFDLEAKNIALETQIDIRLLWNPDEGPAIWPVKIRCIAAGTAFDPKVSRELLDHPVEVLNNDAVTADKDLLLNIRVSPELHVRDEVISASFVSPSN